MPPDKMDIDSVDTYYSDRTLAPTEMVAEKLPKPHSIQEPGHEITSLPVIINNNNDEDDDKADEDELDDDDDNANDELTPPPDSPVLDAIAREHMEMNPSFLSAAPGMEKDEKDEIVVGTKSLHLRRQPSPSIRAESDNNGADADDTEAEVEQEVVSSRTKEQSPTFSSHKRKRLPTGEGLYQDTQDHEATAAEVVATRQQRPAKNQVAALGKSIILGYWRGSQPVDARDKHAVIGFIDVRDRLRTRIQPITRDLRHVGTHYPVPPGPGGSWVTFDNIAFDDHLINLDHFQVKEYVRIRTTTAKVGETPEEKAELDQLAVKQAIEYLELHPPTENGPPHLSVAYGPEIPEHARLAARPEKKRRMGLPNARPINSPSTPKAAPALVASARPAPSHAVPVDNLPGTRPTRVLLGYWKRSSETAVADKHAVYGILGANDMFRVKLTKETRDGRALMGNFPTGPGALWIHWDEVEFEPHLVQLSRPEIKEYCRVRQRHIDEGEHAEHRSVNENQAVYDARKRVEVGGPLGLIRKEEIATPVPILKARDSPTVHGASFSGGVESSATTSTPTTQTKQEPLRRASRPRTSLPDVELRAANRPTNGDRLERAASLVRRQLAPDSPQTRRDQQETDRVGLAKEHHSQFKDNVQRMNKVWAAQEQNRQQDKAWAAREESRERENTWTAQEQSPPQESMDDAKHYEGVKYERKQTGPFQGKLVSQGKIISIDGEDYVEYRVLTKPSFF